MYTKDFIEQLYNELYNSTPGESDMIGSEAVFISRIIINYVRKMGNALQNSGKNFDKIFTEYRDNFLQYISSNSSLSCYYGGNSGEFAEQLYSIFIDLISQIPEDGWIFPKPRWRGELDEYL